MSQVSLIECADPVALFVCGQSDVHLNGSTRFSVCTGFTNCSISTFRSEYPTSLSSSDRLLLSQLFDRLYDENLLIGGTSLQCQYCATPTCSESCYQVKHHYYYHHYFYFIDLFSITRFLMGAFGIVCVALQQQLIVPIRMTSNL